MSYFYCQFALCNVFFVRSVSDTFCVRPMCYPLFVLFVLCVTPKMIRLRFCVLCEFYVMSVSSCVYFC